MFAKRKQRISLALALIMVFSLLIMPGKAFAEAKKGSETSYKKEDSYVTVEEATGMSKDGDKYATVTTFGGGSYEPVTRGDIYLTYPNDYKGDLTKAQVKLKANKEYSFTLNGKTVEPGDAKDFTLDLTKSTKIKVNYPNKNPDEEWSYTIGGGKAGETINVNTYISVENVQKWMDGTYNVPGFPTDPPEKDPEEAARIQDALVGFNELKHVIFTVKKGTSCMEVLGKYGEMFNMDIEGMENNYVSRMSVQGHETLGEFDINTYSGWMYTLNEYTNGKVGDGWYFPNVGAGAKFLTKNTDMNWHFTMAYGSDIDATWGAPGGNPGMPTMLRMNRSYGLEDLVPQWADSGRQMEAVVK